MALAQIADKIRVVDTDAHIIEPEDLWTERLPEKFKDLAPKVELFEKWNQPRWRFNNSWLTPVGFYCSVGHDEPFPSYPNSYADIPKAACDATERLKVMDDYGIYAQVLYPNIVSFDTPAFQRVPELGTACIKAYNDFVVDWVQPAPKRFIPLMMLPFWDLDESVREIRRSAKNGHKGVLFGGDMERFGLPPLIDPHWDPIWAEAQELGLSINFHVGFNAVSSEGAHFDNLVSTEFNFGQFLMGSAVAFSGNLHTIGELILCGVCNRFPNLNFVSAESGFGYIPYLLEAMDWQWVNSGGLKRFPGVELPSEIFRRQVYGSFWFEKKSLPLLPDLADNFFFQTDYPHPTCIAPNPFNDKKPRDIIEQNLVDLPEDVVRKVLWENAARVYHLDD